MECLVQLYHLVKSIDHNERNLKLLDFFLGEQRTEETRLETSKKLFQEYFKLTKSKDLKEIIAQC